MDEGHMAKLFQLSLFFAALCLISSYDLFAQGKCSLIVQVVDPAGRPRQAKVTVTESQGRKVEASGNAAEGYRFCDLGSLPVTVRVGEGGCSEVIVREVVLPWGETRNLKVFYDPWPCDRTSPTVPFCRVLYRFTDEQNRWVQGVTFSPLPSGVDSPQSDEYGRLMVRPRFGTELRMSSRKEGYADQPIQFSCKPGVADHEQIISLQKQ
jgi:hypothetical protein